MDCIGKLKLENKYRRISPSYQSDHSFIHHRFLNEKERKIYTLFVEYNKKYVWNTSNFSFKVPLEEPIFYGIKYIVVPKYFAKIRFPAIEEAINACGEYMLFSGYEPRKCNLKASPLLYTEELNNYFNHNWYIKGKLKFKEISQDEYDSLSKEAKKYFIKHIYMINWKDEPVYNYTCTIPLNYTKNICQKIYIINKTVIDYEEVKRIKEIKKYTHNCFDFNRLYNKYKDKNEWGYGKDNHYFNKRRRLAKRMELREYLNDYNTL